MSVSFQKALMKKAKGPTFKKAAKTKAMAFDRFDVPGSYDCKMTKSEMGVSEDGNPNIRFLFAITEGDHEGKTITLFHEIAERGGRTLEMAWQMLFGDIQRLGFETEAMEGVEEVVEVIQTLNTELPSARIRVKIKNGYPNYLITKLLDDETDDDDEEQEESDDDSDDDSDDSSDDDPSADTDDATNDTDELPPPEIGDEVLYSPRSNVRSSKHIVKKVYKSRQSVDLQRAADKKTFKDVPWEKLS